MAKIFCFCKKSKYGLVDLANAVIYYGNKNDFENTYELIHDLQELFHRFFSNRSKTIVIIWDNSLAGLMAILLSRLIGIYVIYYLHEPGGYSHKRQLKATITYSLLASINEYISAKIANGVGVSLIEKIRYGDYFLPLLYDDRRPKREPSRIIGFVGSKKNERMPSTYKEVMKNLDKAGYSLSYFPSAETGKTAHDKFLFLSKCSAVWNVFAYKYNLSGVTGDCIMSEVPVIISQHEPFLRELNKIGISILVNNQDPPNVIADKILDFLKKSAPLKNEILNSKIKSNFAGDAAFVDRWLFTIHKIVAKS